MHFQMFCAFYVHLFLGFRVYTPMQSIVNHSLFFLLCMIPCFYLCIFFFHFSTLTICMWFCLSSFIKVMTWIFVNMCLWIYMIQILYLLLFTSVFFSVTSSYFFLSPFKYLIYFHLFISPFLSLYLCTSLSSTLSPSISLFVPMFVYISQSLYFFFLLFLSPYVTLSAIVFSTLIYYLSLCVSLISIDYIFPSFFCLYNLFVSISRSQTFNVCIFL
jgi:hypothetical protein